MQNVKRISIFLLFLLFPPHSVISQITTNSANVFYGLGETLKYHYSLIPLYEPEYSEEVFNSLFISMDPEKLFFTVEDLNRFNSMRFTQGEIFETGNLNLPFNAHTILLEKVKSRLPKAIKLINDSNFDYTKKNEILTVDLKKRNWAEDESELDLRWERVIKNKILSTVIRENPNSKDINETIEKNIISELQAAADRHQNASEFEIIGHYANSFLRPVDPHSAYMAPRKAQEFNNTLSSSLEGIGAVLSPYKGNTIIKRLLPGGPAISEGSLQTNDLIVEVKSEDDKEFISTIGKNPEYVGSLLRGPKGTKVFIKVLSETGEEITAHIVRDKVDIKEQMISSSVYKVETNKRLVKIGIITIPIFYSNFINWSETKEKISVADDFAKELVTLDELHSVDGIVIDVRNNIGGPISEVVQMAGSLIKSGPVVSVFDSVAGETTKFDTDDSILYDGPLAIVVNRFSASASEILAGFIKDYKRGIVIGERTHGKGTAQAMLEITPEMYPHLNQNYGTFKFTTKMFFRVNGKSTQKNGIVPHIEYPSNSVPNLFSEANLPNAINPEVLLQKEIPKANCFTPIDLNQLQDNGSDNVYTRAMNAIDSNKGFALLKKRMELVNYSLSNEVVSLNVKARRSHKQSFDKKMVNIIKEILNSVGISEEKNQGQKNDYKTERAFNAAVDSIEIKTAADILADYITHTTN